MRGDDAEATGLAPTPADPTELADLLDYPTESAYAWAEDVDDEPTVRFTPKRITALGVAASLTAIVIAGAVAFMAIRDFQRGDPVLIGQASASFSGTPIGRSHHRRPRSR